MKRMWINQPSTSQPLHHLHGTNVLADFSKPAPVRIYFLAGDIISQLAPDLTLSEGWTTTKFVDHVAVEVEARLGRAMSPHERAEYKARRICGATDPMDIVRALGGVK